MRVIETLRVSVVVRYVIAGGYHSRTKFPGYSKRCFRWYDMFPQQHTCLALAVVFLEVEINKGAYQLSPVIEVGSDFLCQLYCMQQQ